MPIIITPGLGGILQFQNLTPLAPSLIAANLTLDESREMRFWSLAPQAQLETLASAYHHLVRFSESKSELIDSLGGMIQRFHGGEKSIPADSFILARLIGEVEKFKDSVPPTSAPTSSDRPAATGDIFIREQPKTPPPPAETPVRRPTPRRDNSMRLYTDGKGGYFPPLWGGMPDLLKLELKSLAYKLEGKMSDLTRDEGAHSEFLSSSFAVWILDLRDQLAKEPISPASIRRQVAIVSEMAAFMADPLHSESIGFRFWNAVGANAEVRMVINRLANARMLPETLGDKERASVEKAMFDVDAAFLRSILRFLPANTSEAIEESSNRDESYGELLAKKFGEALDGIPLSERSVLSASAQVHLNSALSVLRILDKELSGEPSPAVRGFLKKLVPRQMMQLATVVALGSRV